MISETGGRPFVAPGGAARKVNDPDALARIDGSYVHKIQPRNVILARLDRVPGEVDLFEGELTPDWDHPFFFEHPLDHVPSMMLVESGRQMAIAISHKFYDVPLGVVFITRSYELRFTDFAEVLTEVPVTIRAHVKNAQYRKGRLWSLDLTGRFSQGERDLGTMQGTFVYFDRDVYVRFRRFQRKRRG